MTIYASVLYRRDDRIDRPANLSRETLCKICKHPEEALFHPVRFSFKKQKFSNNLSFQHVLLLPLFAIIGESIYQHIQLFNQLSIYDYVQTIQVNCETIKVVGRNFNSGLIELSTTHGICSDVIYHI